MIGVTFGLKLMDRFEQNARKIDYADLDPCVPEVTKVLEDEKEHEYSLLDMLNEQRLDFIGSIVLGLNDALVELTGTLAGLSFVFQQARLIDLSGLITASLSMASSDYLAKKAENHDNTLRSSLYAGTVCIDSSDASGDSLSGAG